MFYIDDATAVASPPANPPGGAEGYFTEGNPAAGQPATRVRMSWLNMIQLELGAIVAAAGILRTKGITNQVLSALYSLFGGVGMLGATGYMRLPGKVILQWGNAATTTGNQNAIAFPLTFPSACWGVIPCEANAGAWGTSPPSPRVLGTNGANVSGFFVSAVIVQPTGSSPTYSPGTNFFFIALGN